MVLSNLSDDGDQNDELLDEDEDADEMEGFHETDDEDEEEVDGIEKVESATDFDDDAAKNDW